MKFRRVARVFKAHRLDYADAAELVAMIMTLGDTRHAMRVFEWDWATRVEADGLLKHLSDDENVLRMVQENWDAFERADGLATLAVMKDCGWTWGSVPRLVKMALLDMRDHGMSMPAVAKASGLSLDQVRNILTGVRAGRVSAALPASSWVASSFEGQS